MRITIEPSDSSFPGPKVTIDTRTDDEGTADAVKAALDAVIIYGHAECNVKEAAYDYGRVPDLRVAD